MFPSELFNDDGFRQLDDGPQRLFMWLWLHPDLNGAGVIAIQAKEWAKAAGNLTEERIQSYAKALRSEHWVDYDGGQLWLRPFMALDGVLRSPSGYISAARAVKTIRSRTLRLAVWNVFRMFPRPIAPMPDAEDDKDGRKAKRAVGLNESVDRAWAELGHSVSNPGVRESLPTPPGMPHPIPPPMGSVGVDHDAEDGVEGRNPQLNGQPPEAIGLCANGCGDRAGHGSRGAYCKSCAESGTAW
ncbi:MAG: hypothetical protein K2X97_01845 [Mycobacteriaceae bacterium]|nr:hypothetical protein [Mycobacteriaceae bacterium]